MYIDIWTFWAYLTSILSLSSDLNFLTCFKCRTAWQANSLCELVELSGDSLVVRLTWCCCLTLSGCPCSGLCCWPFLLSLEISALHTVAKKLNIWHLEHSFSYAGRFFPPGWVPTCPQYPQGCFSGKLTCSRPAALPRVVYSTSLLNLFFGNFHGAYLKWSVLNLGSIGKELCEIPILVDDFLN